MIKEYCSLCRSKHFNNWKCSKCLLRFTAIKPALRNVSATSPLYGKNIKYCPMCGHKFNYRQRHAKKRMKA